MLTRHAESIAGLIVEPLVQGAGGMRFHDAATLQRLRAMVEKQSEQVRERYNVNVVGFRVDVVDGKVKLKAKPIQE